MNRPAIGPARAVTALRQLRSPHRWAARVILGPALGPALGLVLGLLPAGPRLLAATPTDQLIMAWQIDDLISLDPAESFELSGGEYGAQVYDRLITVDPAAGEADRFLPGVATFWQVGADGRTFTFRIRDDISFPSGARLEAADAAYSLQRAVRLGKAPAFILGQLGLTPDRVDRAVRAPDPATLVIETDQTYASGFVLACLSANVAAVVDRRQVEAQAVDGDYGNGWLKTHSAGSGPFRLRHWKPSELLMLDANPDYWRGSPAMRRVIMRHIPEPATQRLLLEKGDVDIARNLRAEQAEPLRRHPQVTVLEVPKGLIWYLSLNQKHPILAKPEVRAAFRYLIDYQGIRATIMNGLGIVHQTFVPQGFPGEISDRPYSYDPGLARALLAAAGHAEGFTITMDVRNASPTLDLAQAIQASAAKAGVTIELIPGDGKQTLTKYRARRHDLYIGNWGPDYHDPHTNADAFAANPDNADDAPAKPLAWRNAWNIPALTEYTRAARLERDPRRRAALYQALQRTVLADSPFVVMFQQIDLIAQRANLQGMVWGPGFDDSHYWRAVKR